MKVVCISLAKLAFFSCLMVGSVAGQHAFTTPVFSSQRYFVQFTDEPPTPKESTPIRQLPIRSLSGSAATGSIGQPPINSSMPSARTTLLQPAVDPTSATATREGAETEIQQAGSPAALSNPIPVPATTPVAAAQPTPAPAPGQVTPAMSAVPIPAGGHLVPTPVRGPSPTPATPIDATQIDATLTPPAPIPAIPEAAVPTPTAPRATAEVTATLNLAPPSGPPATSDLASDDGAVDVPTSSPRHPTEQVPGARSSNSGPLVNARQRGLARPAFFEGLLQPERFSDAQPPAHSAGNSVGELDALVYGCDTCTDYPCGVWPHRTSFSASLAYMRFRNADVSYGVPVDGPISSILTNPIQVGPVGTVDPDYDTGFDANFNYAMNPLTSIAVDYFSLEATTSDRVGTQAPNVIRSLVAHPSSSSAAADFLNGSADLYLQMNVLDVTLRHLFVGGDVFAINYFGGTRYARFEQQFDSVFVDNGTERVGTDIDFDGAGLTLGLEAEKHSCISCFHVYGRGAASFLAGRFQANYHQGQSFDPTVVDTSWEAGRIVPVLDLELGAGWKSQCGRLKLSAGYMLSAWFNTVKTEDFIEAVQFNDFNNLDHTMTFDGIVGRVEIGF